jgi:hypothetical protein
MLDGVYSFEITFLDTVIKGIAMAENDSIRGTARDNDKKLARDRRTVCPTSHCMDVGGRSTVVPLLRE